MKTLTFLLFFTHVLNCNAQHAYRGAMSLKIIDSTEKVISQSEFSNGNYQVFVQKGKGSLYKETNIDSVGIIHISRNDIMPSDVGLPWNIILIHKSDTMFVQYHNLYNSDTSSVEIKMAEGNYIYDLIRTTNSNLQLEWKLIEFEKILYKEWLNAQLTIKIDCIKKIKEGNVVTAAIKPK